MSSRLFRMITLGIRQFRDPYYQGFAAQIAFYYLLSLVPMVMLLSQLMMSIFQTTIADAVGWLLDAIGGAYSDEVRDLLTYRSAGALNIVYAVIALWAASRAQFALTRIMNFTLTEGRSTGNGYWRERFRSMFTMTLMLLAIIVAVLVLVYGGRLIELFFKDQRIWLWIRWPVAFGLFFLILSFIYKILPTERIPYKQVIPGSIFAAVGLVLVTWLYSLYLNGMAQYDIVYGALTNIVALMFWFYFMAWVLCLGVLFNKVLQDTKGHQGHVMFR